MPSTYTPIATTTLGSAASSVTFSSIPSTYTDLRIAVALTGAASNNVYVQFNGDTGSNYSDTYLQGAAGSASSGRHTSQNQGVLEYIGTTDQHTLTIDINNYSNSTTYKTYLTRGGDAATVVMTVVGLWRSTSAINSVKIYSGNLLTGSTFTLYGVKSA